jgi:hypothetical protein
MLFREAYYGYWVLGFGYWEYTEAGIMQIAAAPNNQ